MCIELGLIRRVYPTDKQTNILILSIYIDWVVAWVYAKTIIELGIVGYCKLSLDKMISNSAYDHVGYYLPRDNLQYPTLPYSITVYYATLVMQRYVIG